MSLSPLGHDDAEKMVHRLMWKAVHSRRRNRGDLRLTPLPPSDRADARTGERLVSASRPDSQRPRGHDKQVSCFFGDGRISSLKPPPPPSSSHIRSSGSTTTLTVDTLIMVTSPNTPPRKDTPPSSLRDSSPAQLVPTQTP